MQILQSKRGRLLCAAALLALLLCLLPKEVDAPQSAEAMPEPKQAQLRPAGEVPAGADLSERTAQGAWLHETLSYTACGHSVQRRIALDARLVGLSRAALEKELPEALPGACVTGFSAREVDVTRSVALPCPMHWMLRTGEDGKLSVLRNLTGEALESVRGTDIIAGELPEQEREKMQQGMIFDEAQALEGYLESLSS